MTPEEAAIRLMIDRYDREALRRFYTSRAAEILSSGDTVRIELYRQWEARELARGRAA